MENLLDLSMSIENEYVKQWKANGGRVVGYACIATPAEILHAAKLLPYRIRALGNSRTEIADAHLSRFNCSFCRSCLQLGLDGTYDFLDGLIETNGCDHLRGMFENWQYVKKSDFFHYLRVPHIVDEDALAYFVEELRRFGTAVADYFEIEITNDALWETIGKHEEIKENLRRLYHLREREKPTVTGAESMKIFLAGTAMTPDDFAESLTGFLDRCETRSGHEYRARLLLAGSATDEVDFVEMIENLGGLIVTDGLCFGARAFWDRTCEQRDDPYQALAEMYLRNLTCPRMFAEFPYRRDLMMAAVKRGRVDGVVLVHNKFCDLHGIENVQLRMALEKAGVPVLTLEKEYGAQADMGRMSTRVQAFLERIEKH